MANTSLTTHDTPVHELYASGPEGFEPALADELRGMGLRQVRPLKGRVAFAGSPADAERACLWSRLASRIFVVLGRFACANAEDLYEATHSIAWERILRAGATIAVTARGTRLASRIFVVLGRFACANAEDLYEATHSIAWERILRAGATIAVTARGTNDELRNSHFAALRVKDALCDRMLEVEGRRPNVDTDDPDARISLTLRGNRASIQLDLSGDPLFKRLPREATRTRAAHVLRPDYAALACAQGNWQEICSAALTNTKDAMGDETRKALEQRVAGEVELDARAVAAQGEGRAMRPNARGRGSSPQRRHGRPRRAHLPHPARRPREHPARPLRRPAVQAPSA